MVLIIDNVSPPLLFFDMIVQVRYNISTNNNWSANMKKRKVETITHTTVSLKPFYFVLNNKNGSLNFIQFSQASITRNTSLDKDFLE